MLGASRIAERAIVGPARSWDTGWSPSRRVTRSGPQLFAEKHGVERVLASYADVVNDPEVDVVYNPLANALHAPWNLAASRRASRC